MGIFDFLFKKKPAEPDSTLVHPDILDSRHGRPQQSLADTLEILKSFGVVDGVCLLGVRGYYLDSMGAAGKNDRGIYDDAIFLIGPDNFYRAFNANTDPAIFRPGIACLKAGVWNYKLGIHGLSKPRAQQYKALVQAGSVTVIRDKIGPDTGFFGINIHRGGSGSVSSIGCQTIRAEQWPEFIEAVEAQMKKTGQKVIKYCLVEQE